MLPQKQEIQGQQPMPTPQAVGGGMPPQAAQQPQQLRGEDVQMLLFSRVQELTPEEMEILDSIITQETLPVLFKLFPELGILFERASAFQDMQPQEDQYSQKEQNTQQNPLVNDNLSRGLMG